MGDFVFGELVGAFRRRLGMTQEELAAKAGVSVREVGSIERGRIATTRASTARLLADALQLDGAERERFCESATNPAGTDPPRRDEHQRSTARSASADPAGGTTASATSRPDQSVVIIMLTVGCCRPAVGSSHCHQGEADNDTGRA
jgi:transcriptional regulator with XRE-family HTH domain